MSNLIVERKDIFKKSMNVGFLVVISRIFGFIRDLLLASYFGVSSNIEAFFVAQRIPNAWRGIFGEGAVNSTFVPVFSRLSVDKKYLWQVFSSSFILVMLIVSGFCLLGIFYTPLIVKIIAPGLVRDPSAFGLCVEITQKIFVYLVIISVYTNFMGLLFSFQLFNSSYLAPVVGNIVFIAGIVFSTKKLSNPIDGLVVFFLLSGLLYFFVQIPSLLKIGWRFRLPRSYKELFLPEVKNICRLLFQRMLIFSVYYINIFLDTIFASLSWIVGAGGIATLYYATRVFLLPLNIIGGSFMTVLIPFLSKYSDPGSRDSFQGTFLYTLKAVGFLIIPCSITLLLFSQPIIRILFERGQFGPSETLEVSRVLVFYAVGLFFFTSNNIFNAFFFSREDLITPFKIALGTLVLNAVLDALLIFHFKLAGIALATSVASIVRFYFYSKLIGSQGVNFREFYGYLKKPFILAVCTGMGMFAFYTVLEINIYIKMVAVLLAGGICYIGLARKLKMFPS